MTAALRPDDEPGDPMAPALPPGASGPGAELERRHDVHDGEIVSLPVRPPIEITARPLATPAPWQAEQEPRRPILAVWLTDARERRAAVQWWVGLQWHRAAYHGVRAPIYGARVVWFAIPGAWRAYAKTRDWVNDGDNRALREAARQRGDDQNFQKYESLRIARRAERIVPARVAWGAILVVLMLAYFLLPPLVTVPVFAAVVAALGILGQSDDRKVFTPAVVPNNYRKLSPGIVKRAFEAAKLADDKNPLSFATGLYRDSNGYSVVLDLFFGRTANAAIDARDVIASGLDVDERQVFLSRVRGPAGSARRVQLWVCDVDPLSIPAGPSPLIEMSRVNFWEGFPLGANERGETVELCVLWGAMLIGAIPRRGKTFVARLVVLAGALDPHVRLWVWDLKGSPDWTAFGRVADRFFLGDRADPETGVHPLAALRDSVDELLVEVDRRNRVLRSLPESICPEGKLTEEIAREPSMNMPIILVMVDEVQRIFSNKEYRDELDVLLTDLAKVGPSVGIILVAATQKPDSKSMPTGFRDQFGIRFALYVSNRDASEAVLGAGAGSEGYRADRLDPNALGSGLLRGTGDAKVNGGIVRTYLADRLDAQAICERARVLREEAGTLSGMALDHVVVTAQAPGHDVLRDLLLAFGDAAKLHSDVCCARLADRWPDRYAGWTPEQLAGALKLDDVRPKRQVWAETLDGESRNRAGYLRADVVAGLDRRESS